MRVDTEQASGAQSHTISNGERTWVWYGGSELYYESAAAFTADEEQGIPTYEDELSRLRNKNERLLSPAGRYVTVPARSDRTRTGTVRRIPFGLR